MNRKEKIIKLLKGIETGDPSSTTVVDEKNYIQHNPQTEQGSVGLAELFKKLSKTSPRVNLVRVFEDGDFIFAHTEYDFSRRNIGFEVFRFDGEFAVEHWDNIQKREGPNSLGYSMVDGEVEITDLDQTEHNRSLIQAFVDTILLNKEQQKLSDYMNLELYQEHSPHLNSGKRIHEAKFLVHANHAANIDYQKCHRILAEGNFVLTVCEGALDDKPTSFYDLYRIESGKIVEHWDTTETIPPQSEWKNNNGKF